MGNPDALAKVEQACVAYVGSVTPWPTSTRVPNPRPDQFCVVSRSGGDRLNIGQSAPRLLFECFGTDTGRAWEVVVDVYAVVLDMDRIDDDLIPHVFVADVDVNEPVNFPDTSAGLARYQFLATLTVTPKE